MSATVDRTALRRAIREYIEANDPATYAGVVAIVAGNNNVDPKAVENELGALESRGFVYLVPTDDGEEVRLV